MTDNKSVAISPEEYIDFGKSRELFNLAVERIIRELLETNESKVSKKIPQRVQEESLDISIKKMDSLSMIEINGVIIKNIIDYQIVDSANGSTEILLKIRIPNCISSFELSTN